MDGAPTVVGEATARVVAEAAATVVEKAAAILLGRLTEQATSVGEAAALLLRQMMEATEVLPPLSFGVYWRLYVYGCPGKQWEQMNPWAFDH